MQQPQRPILAAILVLCLALAACRAAPPASAPTPAPASAPTPSPVAPLAVAATTTIAAPTMSDTPTAAQILRPTGTPTPILAATPTAWPERWQAAQRRFAWRSVAPDGQWVADTVLGIPEPGSMPVTFSVWRPDGTARWLVVDDARPDGLGFPSPAVVRWTGAGLFFTESSTPDGCGVKAYQQGLYRLDLADGSRETIVAETGGTVAVAPPGNRAAWLDEGAGRQILVRNLVTGDERALPLPLAEGDNLAALDWSPSGETLLVISVRDACGGGGTTTIRSLNVESGAARTLIEGDERRLLPLRWSSLGRALLRESGDEGPRDWLLNISTGEIVPFEPADGASAERVMEVEWRSPDGQWLATSTRWGLSGQQDLVELAIFHLYEVREWVLFDEVRQGTQVVTGPHLLRWSDDGRFLYFTEQSHAHGCPAKPHENGLYQLSLADGAVTTLAADTAGSLSISPDGTRAAHLSHIGNEATLIVQDLPGGEQRALTTLPLGPRQGPDAQAQIAALLWSPDGERLLVATTDYNCVPRLLTFYLAPLDGGALVTLAETVETPFGARIEWAEPETVQMHISAEEIWYLDVETGTIMKPEESSHSPDGERRFQVLLG